jgi:hypothetical protein
MGTQLETPDPYHYARKKFWEAVYALVSDGNIKDRLAHAQNDLLRLKPDEDLPENLRTRFRRLMRDLDDRTIHCSHRPSRVNTRHPKAGRMAMEILEIYTALRGGI